MRSMNILVFLHEIYEHFVSLGPSNKLFSRLRYRYYAKLLKKSDGFFISGTGFSILVPENTSIGRDVYFNRNVWLGGIRGDDASEIIIGDYCQFGPNVVIIASDHAVNEVTRPMRLQNSVPGKIVIGEDCWIGANVTITRGVSIGKGSIIGANSVVTRDIPEYSVAAGVPARVIRDRRSGKSERNH